MNNRHNGFFMKKFFMLGVIFVAFFLSGCGGDDNPVTSGSDGTVSISFSDFADRSKLTLNGSAVSINSTPIVDNGKTVIRLTNDLNQRGTAFLTSTIALEAGGKNLSFNSMFQFKISNLNGADGLAFAITTSPASLGGGGGGIGYEGLNPSVVVEFDTNNNGVVDDSSVNHVGINLNGSIDSVVLQPIVAALNNGTVWTVWIDYDGSTNILEVRVVNSGTKPTAPLLSTTVDIKGTLGQSNIFVGFTSGTGLLSGNHDILAWEFNTTTQ